MIKFRNLKKDDIKNVINLFNEDVASLGFFKPLDYDEFMDKFVGDIDFSFDGAFGAFDDELLIGFAIGLIREQTKVNPNAPGYLNLFIIKKEYRGQGIGDTLVKSVEKFVKDNGRLSIQASFYLPLCFSWFIPGFPGHDHPCAPGIRVNSEEYFFLLHRGYEAIGFEDAFHLPLASYELSPRVKEILEENKKDGITIEFYDENKHYGLDEFYIDIDAIDFTKCIKANLALDKPNPFLVVSQNGQVKGWTGALWNEPSGREYGERGNDRSRQSDDFYKVLCRELSGKPADADLLGSRRRFLIRLRL